METDVNHIMGRGETSNVSGIPTLSRLLTDIDELNANKTKVTNDFDTFQTTMTEKLAEETKQVFVLSITYIITLMKQYENLFFFSKI